jgi:hypothetical protein
LPMVKEQKIYLPIWFEWWEGLHVNGSRSLQLVKASSVCRKVLSKSNSEPAPTSAPWKMNDKWSENTFLLGSSSQANHDS